MNYVLGRADKLVEATGNDESAATVYTPAADIGSSAGTGPRPVPHTAPVAAAPSSAFSPPSAFGNPVVTPSAPVVRPGSAVKVISAAEAANPSPGTGRISGPPRHGTAQGTGAAGSSAAISSSGLSLATLPQAAAFPPPGIESIAPQRTAARPGSAGQSQMFNGPAPETKRPLGLLLGTLAVGAVLGFMFAKSTIKPPVDASGCARPSSSPKDIEAAYELLLKAQMMFEAGDPSGASSKAQEAQTRSGTSRGHYILGTMRLAAGDAAGALAHYRCVLELGPASQEATAIQRLLNNKR